MNNLEDYAKIFAAKAKKRKERTLAFLISTGVCSAAYSFLSWTGTQNCLASPSKPCEAQYTLNPFEHPHAFLFSLGLLIAAYSIYLVSEE